MLSILIPTYNREDKLKKLVSFIERTYINNKIEYEVDILIGNDYPEKISIAKSEVKNLTITVFNNEKNLGEAGNLNYLLNLAKYPYIVWLFDDDSIDPCFFSYFQDVIDKIKHFDVFLFQYSKNSQDSIYRDDSIVSRNEFKLTNGKDFAIAGEYANFIGFVAIYNRRSVLDIGGVTKLSNQPIAVGSEYDLIFQAIKFDRIVLSDAKLIRVCLHTGSYSSSVLDYIPFYESGINLYKRSISDEIVKIFPNNNQPYLEFLFFFVTTNVLNRIFSTLKIKDSFKIFNNFIFELNKYDSVYCFDKKHILIKAIAYSFFVSIYKRLAPLKLRLFISIRLRK